MQLMREILDNGKLQRGGGRRRGCFVLTAGGDANWSSFKGRPTPFVTTYCNHQSPLPLCTLCFAPLRSLPRAPAAIRNGFIVLDGFVKAEGALSPTKGSMKSSVVTSSPLPPAGNNLSLSVLLNYTTLIRDVVIVMLFYHS